MTTAILEANQHLDEINENIKKIGTQRFDYNLLKHKILVGCETIVDITTRKIVEESETLKPSEFKSLVSAFKDGAMVARAFIPDEVVENNPEKFKSVLDHRREEIIDVLIKQRKDELES